MTLRDFFVLFGIAHRKTVFAVDTLGAIRNSLGQCPVCGVAWLLKKNRSGIKTNATVLGPSIGLSEDLSVDLAMASDTELPGQSDYARHVNGLRTRMLETMALTAGAKP